MKTLQLNTYLSGGAAVAARRLHEGLLAEGVKSVFGCETATQASWAIPCGKAKERSKIGEAIARQFCYRLYKWRLQGTKQSTFLSDPETRIGPKQLSVFFPVDVINLHWIANYIDWQTCLPWLALQAPLVWTLHDMNPFSGIWHYAPNNDERSPRMERWNQKVLASKMRIFEQIPEDRLVIISPSRWLAAEANKSALLGGFATKVIPNGLDTDFFLPLDQKIARTGLGIDHHRAVVGFIAEGTKDPRKGLPILLQALRAIPADVRPHLLVAGGDFENPDGLEFTTLGKIQSDSLLRLFFSSLNLFVCPSVQDNLPNTVLEAMACGVPTVAFETGGLPDMVRPGVTGWLSANGDPLALSHAIQEALNDPLRLREIGVSCREVAVRDYSVKVQAKAYHSVYSELLQGNHS